jgi:hypothetical protein
MVAERIIKGINIWKWLGSFKMIISRIRDRPMFALPIERRMSSDPSNREITVPITTVHVPSQTRKTRQKYKFSVENK